MTERITERMLDRLCERLNKMTGSPLEPYSTDPRGRIRTLVGHYHIGRSEAGVRLSRMRTGAGEVDNPLGPEYLPKRELWNRMRAFVAGIETAKADNRLGVPISGTEEIRVII